MAPSHVPVPFSLLPEIKSGDTADVYFLRSRAVLYHMGIDPNVGMVVFPSAAGVLCGTTQVVQLLREVGFSGKLWSLPEGANVAAREPAMHIYGPYSEFGVYETAILGMLASCTAWATAAQDVVLAAAGVPVMSFGARHVHPNVAGIMDYAAVTGGCASCSTPMGAALTGTNPSGTMAHAFVLVVGDTVEAAKAFHLSVPSDVPRIVLVDTFQDEAVESLRVADALGSALAGVRLDTPAERGGVTPALVREVRARLDAAGHGGVKIVVSGGVTPARIMAFREADAPVDSYGVGSYISHASPIDFTADVREISGHAVAKRGRIPGMEANARLTQVL